MKIVNPERAFSDESRNRLLTAYFEAYERLVDADLDGRNDDEAVALVSKYWDEYLAGLPVVEISRNPFSGVVFKRSLDIAGLDGLWWNSENPARPVELLAANEVAFTGAVSLREPVEQVPFICKPGPGVPFVVPRIIKQEGVKAVLSSIPIGRHQGYAIVYFAEAELRTLEGFGDWGRTIAYYDTGDDDFGWQEWIPAPSDFDFDLMPWIRNGKLVWIAPEDDDLAIQTSTDCPYLGVSGNRFYQVVSNGKVWQDTLYEPPVDVEEYEADDVEDAQTDETPEKQVQSVPTPPPVSAEQPQQHKFCRQCGSQLKPAARFCPKCGTAVVK